MIIGLVGLLVVVGLGIVLVRWGMGRLSSSITSAIRPTVQAVQVKVVFAGQSITPTLAASSGLAPTQDANAPATAVMAADSNAPKIEVTLPVLATNTVEPTAPPAATETVVPTDTPAPTHTPPATSTPAPTATAIPATATELPPTPTKAPPASSAFRDYQVQAGDSCSQIAESNGVSLETFAATNLLDANNCVLKVGATVRIPRVPAATGTVVGKAISTPAGKPPAIQTEYIVQSGDTCGGIAYRFKITAAQLVAANSGLSRTSCFLKVGQKLVIPKSDAIVPTTTLAPAPTAVPIRSYTVQQGDVCGVIAKRFGVTVVRLAAANNLDAATCPLKVGRTLVIPEP